MLKKIILIKIIQKKKKKCTIRAKIKNIKFFYLFNFIIYGYEKKNVKSFIKLKKRI